MTRLLRSRVLYESRYKNERDDGHCSSPSSSYCVAYWSSYSVLLRLLLRALPLILRFIHLLPPPCSNSYFSSCDQSISLTLNRTLSPGFATTIYAAFAFAVVIAIAVWTAMTNYIPIAAATTIASHTYHY